MSSLLTPGAETRVNTTTADNQHDASVTGLSDGGYVVTWMSLSQDGSGYGVYAQRYDATGNTVGGETLVNTTTASHQEFPIVAALSDGGYVVTWMSLSQGGSAFDFSSQNGSAFDIYAQRYDATGNTVGSETLVNTTTGNQQFYPWVTGLSDGGYVVTWTSRSPGHDIYAQHYDATGNTVGSETRVNTTTAGEQYQPTVAALSDGGYVVTWGSLSGSGWGVDAQRYDANGNTVGSEIHVNTTTVGGEIPRPRVAALSDGGYIVTWRSEAQDGSGDGVYAQRYDANGNTVGSETLVNTTTAGNQLYPSVTGLSDGGYVVAWMSSPQDGSGVGIYAQQYDQLGNAVGGETLVNTTTAGDQVWPNVSALSDGGYVVTWTSLSQDGSGWGVYSRAFVSDEAPVITNDAAQSVAENSTIVAALNSTEPATFSISGGTDAALFDIVDGNLVFRSAKDFETDPHSYQVEVSAFDGVNTTAKMLTVSLTDANDNAPVITSPNEQTITAVADLNDLGDFAGFAAPLTVGIYTFTTDDGQLRYANFGENNSYALGDNTDLGFINIAIAPGAYVTKFSFLVGLAGEAQNHSETVSFFDTNNLLLETVYVSRNGGYQFVSFETTSGFIGRVLVTDTKLNSTVVTVDNLEVQLAPAPLAVDENTTFVAALTSTDADTVGTNPATFSITGGTDAALFDIVEGNLVFKAAPDYETDPHSYQVEVSAFDGVNTTAEMITVSVTDVNEAPTVVALTNTTVSVLENTSTASHIKVADITITDDALGTNTLALTGADAAFFEIVGSSLYLKAGTVLDFESKTSYAVAVTVDDPTLGATPDATSTTYALSVSNVPGVTITGTSAANTIDATHTVAGQPLPTNEEDTINAGAGNDTINALGGNDFIDGGAGADTMFGGTGNDTYVVDKSGDVVNETGGNGLDTVLSSITFSLSDATQAIGAIEKLTLTGTAKINGTGNALANEIIGNSGNNILNGLEGADTLTGGQGSDKFMFTALAHSTPSASDLITDFVSGSDIIDLSTIDANTSKGGNQAFAFGGQNANVVANSVTWVEINGSTIVQADANGDTTADLQIVLLGTNLNLHATDFVL